MAALRGGGAAYAPGTARAGVGGRSRGRAGAAGAGGRAQGQQGTDTLRDDYRSYVQPSTSPTVPRGTERLRITPSPVHGDAMMDDLVAALTAIWGALELKRAA